MIVGIFRKTYQYKASDYFCASLVSLGLICFNYSKVRGIAHKQFR